MGFGYDFEFGYGFDKEEKVYGECDVCGEDINYLDDCYEVSGDLVCDNCTYFYMQRYLKEW